MDWALEYDEELGLLRLPATGAASQEVLQRLTHDLDPGTDPNAYVLRCERAAEQAANADRLDDALVLAMLATSRLRQVQPLPHQELASLHYTLSSLCMRRTTGDREDSREAALHFLLRATQHHIDNPLLAARVWGALSDRYARRSRGKRANNQRKALEAYRSALRMGPPFGPLVHEWATNAHHYGLTLLEVEGGDQLANAAAALEAHWQAAAAAGNIGRKDLARRATRGCGEALKTVLTRLAEHREPTPLEVAAPPDGADDSPAAQLSRMQAVVGVVMADLNAPTWEPQAVPAALCWERVFATAEESGQSSLQGVALLHMARLCRLIIHAEPDAGNTERARLFRAALLIDPLLHPWSWDQNERELAALFIPDTASESEGAREPVAEVVEGAALLGRLLRHRAMGDLDRLEPGDLRAQALIEAAIGQLRRALALAAEGPAYTRTRIQVRLSLAQALSARPWRRSVAEHEEARGSLEAALTEADRSADPQLWATLNHELGVNYQNRSTGSPEENRETAIVHLESALTDSEQSTRNRIATLGQVATAYLHRLRGDPVDNTDRALAYYAQALRLRDRASEPVRWAITMHNLGTLYLARARLGDRQSHLLAAIDCFRRALVVRTREELPEHWAMTMMELGVALLDADSTAAGREHLRQAQTVYTRERSPAAWAKAQWTMAQDAVERSDLTEADRLLQPLLDLPLERDNPELAARVAMTRGLVGFDLGMAEENLGRAEAGLHTLDESVRQLRAAGAWDEAGTAALWLGDRCLMLEAFEDAARAYLYALDVDARRYAVSLTLGSRQSAIGENWLVTARAAYALTRCHRPDEAVDVLERGRARMLGEALARDRTDLQHLLDGNAEERAAAERYLAAAAAVRALEAEERHLDTERLTSL